jgi:D-alanyl-D-alanine carboxypeptidase (penicillin-binding protein 5/6)
VSASASSTGSSDPSSTTVDNAADKSPMYAAFGNVGMPLTILAGLVVLAALGMYLRKRRARAARARRLAAQNNG